MMRRFARMACGAVLAVLAACSDPQGHADGEDPDSGPALSEEAPAEDRRETPGYASGLDQAASLAASCSGCHVSSGSALADLGALDAATIAASLTAYKADADGTTVMHRLARGYSADEIDRIAAYLGAEREQ